MLLSACTLYSVQRTRAGEGGGLPVSDWPSRAAAKNQQKRASVQVFYARQRELEMKKVSSPLECARVGGGGGARGSERKTMLHGHACTWV